MGLLDLARLLLLVALALLAAASASAPPLWDSANPDKNPGPRSNAQLAGKRAENGSPRIISLRTSEVSSLHASSRLLPWFISTRISQGDIHIKLRGDWHRPSTVAVASLADTPDSCRACELYRVEPGFLVQGILKGSLPVNTATGCDPAPGCQPGPRVMVGGDVGWAGGGAGPDFFIYLGSEVCPL